LKNKESNIAYGVKPILALLAMWLTQDIAMRLFFSKKYIKGQEFLTSINGSVVIAPTHRSRWDGLVLTYALGRRITNKDCRFMVTNPEMRGLQGWFLKRLGCFSINQESPSLLSLKYALNLIISHKQLVIFPEGKINKKGKKIPYKQGLFRLASIANKKGTNVSVVPIGIAYDNVNPKFRGKVALCIQEPIAIDKFSSTSIDDFNEYLRLKIEDAEIQALGLVGRGLRNQLK
tara:strand:+ start:1348 stop:2043 length:696 start_codon:yes stop_codon:yes gene_type:complete